MKKSVLFVFVLLLTSGCQNEELMVEGEKTMPNDTLVVMDDSLSIYLSQSDKGKMLSNAVHLRNGQLELDLTLEDALSIGIDQSMYENQIKQIENINKSNLKFKER